MQGGKEEGGKIRRPARYGGDGAFRQGGGREDGPGVRQAGMDPAPGPFQVPPVLPRRLRYSSTRNFL